MKHMKERLKIIAATFLVFLFAGTTNVFAQAATTTEPSFWSDPLNSPQLPYYLTLTMVGVTILLIIVVLFYIMRVLNIMIRQAEEERAIRLGQPVRVHQTWWEKFWQQLNDSVPVSQEKDIDLGHNYDGIRELDNHLPPWWTGLFYATIIWGLIYLVVYHVTNNLPLSRDEYENELTQAAEQAKILQASQPQEVIDANTLEYKADKDLIANGQKVFMSNNCGSCHRNDGGGNGIGPNLTDNYWIHGGLVKNIFTTIDKGVVEKGMPAWGKVMSPKDVRDVAFFVMSLQGTNPPDAKAPQGDLFKPETAPADTTQTVAPVN